MMRAMNPRMKLRRPQLKTRVSRANSLHELIQVSHISRGALLLSCVLFLAGCGGGDSAETNAPVSLQTLPVAKPAGAAENQAQELPKEPEPEEKPVEEPVMEEPASEPEPEPVELPPEKRERPEDFAEWTLEEFRDEHAENGRRFEEAVEYLAENKADDPETTQLLSDLIVYREPEIDPPPETDDERELEKYEKKKESDLKRARLNQARQAPAIITALGTIGGDVAIETLLKLIAGNLDCGLDSKRACESALNSLIVMESDQVQDFMYTAVTAPAEVRTNDDGSFPPEQLQASVLKQLPNLASHQLRTKLGEFAAQVGPTDPAFSQLWRMLSDSRADNLRGQVLLYLSPKLEERQSEQLHRLFTQHSQSALSHLLGISQDAGNSQTRRSSRGGFGGGSSRSAEVENIDELTYETARELWTLRFLAAMSEEMQEVSDLGSGMPTVSLIGSMPVAPIRQGIKGYLDEHWDEISEQKISQLPEKLADALQDPALLLILKDVPRRRDPDVRSERRNGSSSTSRARSRTTTNTNDARQMREESQYIWMDTTEEMVQAMNARMLAAASAIETSDDSSDDAAPTEAATEEVAATGLPAGFELPYELHEGANVVATHEVSWPDDVKEVLQDQELAPLKVHYVRIECEDVLNKVASHYQRQLGKSQTRFLENEGRWLDLLEELDTGWNRSTDVMIRRVDEKERSEEEQKNSRYDPEPLVVEILMVETPAEEPEEDAGEADAG